MGVETRRKRQLKKENKNWKLIDTTAEEERKAQIMAEKAEKEALKASKDIFVLDGGPKKKVRESRVEKKILKRMEKNFTEDKLEVVPAKDIWAEEGQTKGKKVNYPHVPKPHPGQSYNPSKKDLSSLLNRLQESYAKPEVPLEKIDLKSKVLSDSDSESEELENFTANDAVTSESRLTRSQRNKKAKKRDNIRLNQEQRLKKQIKGELEHLVGAKKFENKLAETLKKKEKLAKAQKKAKEAEEVLKSRGVVKESVFK